MLIKCKVIQQFNLKNFSELKNIKRASALTKEGTLYKNDTFECDEELAKYLLGNNHLNKVVVKVIMVIPDNLTIR